MARRGSINQNALNPGHAHVERDSRKSAQSSGQDRKREQPLPLVRHAAHQPRDKTGVESC
jgi:hypothetical protein